MRFYTVVAALLCCFSAGAQVLVETESFENPGGWVRDHQAFEKIYSGYMLAHGAGRPVEDATTTVKIDKPGHYYVYASTYNWTAPWYDGEGPGAFQIAVDGVLLPATLGTKGNEWMWQYAGEVDITNTSIELSLKDLTGFEGRCDAVWLSRRNCSPEPDYKAFSSRRGKLLGFPKARTSPQLDLVVVGGGLAGCTAALTAARYGMKVALVDNLPWLGGNSTLEVTISGHAFKNIYPNLGYVAFEVAGFYPADKNKPEAYSVNPKNKIGGPRKEYFRQGHYDPVIDPRGADIQNAAQKVIAAGELSDMRDEKQLINAEYGRRNGAIEREKLLEDAGVLVFHDMHVFDVRVNDGEIRSITARSLKSGEDFIFSAPLFTDCTGDGTVGYLAGAEFMIGREGKAFAGEPSAPDEPDDKKMGTSMIWYAFPRANSGTFPKPSQIPWAVQVDSSYHIDTYKWAWWWETGLQTDNALNAELVRDNYFRAVFGNWAYLKNYEAKYADFRLDYLEHYGMKRESRRIVGDLILTENDVAQKKAYPDASFTTTWTMDVHSARRDNYERFGQWAWTTVSSNHRKEAIVDRYDVPYRCLYSKDISNLFIGGRNMSVSHMALGTVRVQLTLAQASEVIGMASAICHRHSCNPRAVYQQYLDELKKQMTDGAPGRITILPVGDSITQGGGNCTSYTYPLYKMLRADGLDFSFIGPRTHIYEDVGEIRHCGYGGKTIEYFVPRIDTLYRHYNADIVIIHSGHNHFADKNPVAGIIESHRRTIDSIRAINPDVKIIVCQVITSGKLPKYSYIPQLNDELASMVKSYHSDNIVTVNLEKGFVWETMTADDHVHPLPCGAEFIAGKIHRQLKPLMNQIYKSRCEK